MLNNLKIELLDNLNLIYEIAKNKLPSFPTELSKFLQTEFDQKQVIIAKETNENSFELICKIDNDAISFDKETLSLLNYSEISKSIEFETDPILTCELDNISGKSYIHSYIVVIEGNIKFLFIFKSRYNVTDQEKEHIQLILRFIQRMLEIWNSSGESSNQEISVNSFEFFSKTTNNLIKEIKTNNGLLTLVKEEKLSKNVGNYFNEIRNQNSKVLKHFNQIIELVSFETKIHYKDDIEIKLSSLMENCVSRIETSFPNTHFINEINSNNTITLDKDTLEKAISNVLFFISSLCNLEYVKISSDIHQSKFRISIQTEIQNSNREKTKYLMEHTNTYDPLNIKNGLDIVLAKKYLSTIGGKLRFIEKDKKFITNVTIPVQKEPYNKIIDSLSKTEKSGKDKILIIESDPDLTSLLKNHLKKWKFVTEIVSSGKQALEMISRDKYLAIILNVEQDDDNSLLLLQSIKNKKEVRNIPVIVFSAEPENDKIYLMGSVEYLVKPVNYNNLIEILSSYKLRHDSIVLCVDDDMPTLNLVKQAVNTAGFNSLAINRSEHVIDEIIEKDIELAIIDLDMPKINGFDLIRNIKSLEKFAKLPIIIYTGKEDYQNDLEQIDGLFVDLLEKRSTSIEELEKTIFEMIKNYEEPNKVDSQIKNFEGPKILMAEDYKHSQIIVSRLLKKSGFLNIIVVENGEEALNICENDTVDLILMDMQMPIMNGFEATGKIRELPGYKDTPIIALTAFAMKGDREKCLDAGATDYIPKPIDSKEFIEKVQYYTQVEVTNR